jgi:hypothetical protein
MGASKHGPQDAICPICGADMSENGDGELECFGPNCESELYLEDDGRDDE